MTYNVLMGTLNPTHSLTLGTEVTDIPECLTIIDVLCVGGYYDFAFV